MRHFKSTHEISYTDLDHAHENSGSLQMRPPNELDESASFLEARTPPFWGLTWALEILACLVSIAILAAIIGFLSHYEGSPLPEWPYITLNAVISILSTAMKAAIAFIATQCLAQLKWLWFGRKNRLSDLTFLDDASRGPVGAFKVLYSFLPRHLVTFGCLILVLAVATDPFVQQVLSIQMRPVQAPGLSASIQVCNSSYKYSDFGLGAGPGMNKVPLASMGAIYSGIFKTELPNSNQSTMVSCPTGNCTFVPYQTLGFCSQCANITDALKISGSERMYSFALPNGLTLSSNSIIMNATVGLDMLQINTTAKAAILKFTAISAAGAADPSKASAAECVLSFCVQTYEASVSQGAFVENLIASDTRVTATSGDQYRPDYALTPETCYSDGTLYEKPLEHPERCTYNVWGMSVMALQNSIRPLLMGSGSLFANYRLQWSTDTLQAVYGTYGNYTEIQSAFESLGSSLSTNARSRVCNSTTAGTTWTNSSYVQVRWHWLILPGSLVVFSLVLMVATIIRTRKQHVWKSSPLVLLFSTLEVDAMAPWEKGGPTLNEIDAVSKKMDLRLEPEQDGVKFRATRI